MVDAQRLNFRGSPSSILAYGTSSRNIGPAIEARVVSTTELVRNGGEGTGDKLGRDPETRAITAALMESVQGGAQVRTSELPRID